METNWNSGHFNDQLLNPEKPKQSFFLWPDFPGKEALVNQLVTKKARIHDKDWSAYEYGTSTINSEAIKFENEIRLTLTIGRIPVLIWLDITSLPDDLKVLIEEGKIIVVSPEPESGVQSLIKEIAGQAQNIFFNQKSRTRRHSHFLRVHL
jgi:hypothetical protein